LNGSVTIDCAKRPTGFTSGVYRVATNDATCTNGGLLKRVTSGASTLPGSTGVTGTIFKEAPSKVTFSCSNGFQDSSTPSLFDVLKISSDLFTSKLGYVSVQCCPF
jgi:hypothetical protein